MALGLGKKSAERLGVKLSDIERIADFAPDGYYQWQATRDKMQRLYPRTDRWLSQCYNMPSKDAIIMSMFDDLLEGFGVEPIRIEDMHVDNFHFDIVASYVNMGDTYSVTELLDHRTGRFMVTSWGDFVELNNF